ncbi:MAG: NUDIX domain-containing protein [Planctomycetia bacterium]|nr:NUDIX domain-containing protein [Planctomycetia bacterium]
MTPQRKYCPYCKSKISRKRIENRIRDYCRTCNTIFYDNPLPVVSAVVPNKKREILLVLRDRDPYAGQWCLPSGFVELNESVEKAVIRELKEETGIKGKVLRLLDTNSRYNEIYGDLIWVTFEVKKSSGKVIAGDDARDAKYFPISDLPKLPFHANRRAVKRFKKNHRDLWHMEDSFKNLSSKQGKPKLDLPTDSLYKIISKDSQLITENWVSEVCSHKSTTKYGKYSRDILYERAYQVISQFSDWMTTPMGQKKHIWDYYTKVGQQRYEQGFKLSEVLSALSLTRKHIFAHVLAKRNVWKKSIAMYQVLEFMWQVNYFFDKANYYVTYGFENSTNSLVK